MNKTRIKAAAASAVLGILSPLAMAAPAGAATRTFEARSITDIGNLNATTSWEGSIVPMSGDDLVFPASASYQTIINDMPGFGFLAANIIFNGENGGSSSKSYAITGSPFYITEGIDAVMTGSGGDHSVATDVTLNDDATFRTTGSNTLSVGLEGSVLDLGDNELTLDASGGTISLVGKVSGTGNIIKSGSGKIDLQLTTSEDGYTGSVSVSSGETKVNQDLGTNIALSGGTLKGTGTVGSVTMSSGVVAPGNSPGVLNTGDLSYTGGTFAVELGGTGDGEYDQTNVTGIVDLGDATDLTVTLVNGFEPEVDDVFTIINNDASDAIVGTFDEVSDGDKFTLGDYTYQINYDSGSGNDVTLIVTGTPSAPDTGVGTIINSPMAPLRAALLAAGAMVGLKKVNSAKN